MSGGARRARPSQWAPIPWFGSVAHGGVSTSRDSPVPNLHPPLGLQQQRPSGKHPKTPEKPQNPMALSQATQKEEKPPVTAALSSPGGHRPGAAMAWGQRCPGDAGEAEPVAILGVTLRATASP